MSHSQPFFTVMCIFYNRVSEEDEEKKKDGLFLRLPVIPESLVPYVMKLEWKETEHGSYRILKFLYSLQSRYFLYLLPTYP